MRGLCLLLFVAAAYASASKVEVSAPLFAWSNQAYFTDAGAGAAKATYQVFSDLRDTLKLLVSSSVTTGHDVGQFSSLIDQQALDEHKPEVVLLVLGNQLKTSDLRSRVMRTPLLPLQDMLQSAASSLSAPYMVHEAISAVDQRSRLVQLTSGMAQTTVVGCGPEHEQDLTLALQQLGDEPAIVVVCTNADAAAAGTPQAVAAELQQLQAAHDGVAALNKRQLTIYAVTPDVALMQQHGRELLGVGEDVGVCGQLCQTQVKWLEGILAAMILAFAAFSGMCCLYMLDTPTRFEKPKEGARND